MTKQQFDREMDFRLSIAVMKQLYHLGFINKMQLSHACNLLQKRFQPPFGGLKDVLSGE